jgi:hypothetical protein
LRFCASRRRKQPGKVVGVERTVIVGESPVNLIGTSHVERLNISVRMASAGSRG